MNSFYLDTNVFLYLAEIKEPHHKIAVKALNNLTLSKQALSTSVETFQEVVHYAKKQHHLKYGLKICQLIFNLVPHPLPIDQSVTIKYLKLAAKYPQLESRDCLHLATCFTYNLPLLITEDKNLLKTKVKQIKIVSLQQAQNLLKLTN